jgi:hypothetical protein
MYVRQRSGTKVKHLLTSACLLVISAMVSLKIPHPGHFAALQEIIAVKEAEGLDEVDEVPCSMRFASRPSTRTSMGSR